MGACLSTVNAGSTAAEISSSPFACPLGYGQGVLSALFQRKFLSYLKEAFQKKKLSFHGQLQSLADENNWKRFLRSLRQGDWVVYTKPPFGGAQQLLKYLARYTHRVAISNQRLVSVEDGKVRFSWKDYRNGHKQRTMTLDAVEFLRRFLLYVPPTDSCESDTTDSSPIASVERSSPCAGASWALTRSQASPHPNQSKRDLIPYRSSMISPSAPCVTKGI